MVYFPILKVPPFFRLSFSFRISRASTKLLPPHPPYIYLQATYSFLHPSSSIIPYKKRTQILHWARDVQQNRQTFRTSNPAPEYKLTERNQKGGKKEKKKTLPRKSWIELLSSQVCFYGYSKFTTTQQSAMNRYPNTLSLMQTIWDGQLQQFNSNVSYR